MQDIDPTKPPNSRASLQPRSKVHPKEIANRSSQGFCIFINTLAEGAVPSVRDAQGKPFLFSTREEAEREIIDQMMIHLQQYLDGERDFDEGNSIIKQVSHEMGRTPSSLAMKLSNFASLDPVQRARGIRGLGGATNQDRAMWAEYRDHLESLGPESEQLLHDLFTTDENSEVDFLERNKVRVERVDKISLPAGPTEVLASVKIRRGQQFFRQSILNAYGVSCCISGINVPRLLVASHIKPWRDFPADRLNPRNGLCLSSLHDAAFDAGLIAIDRESRVVLSKRLRSFFPQPALEQNFLPYEGRAIRLPDKIAEPDGAFLAYHRDSIFSD